MRRTSLAPFVVALALSLAAYAPALRPGHQLAGRDVYVLFHPLFERVAAAEREGRLPRRDPLRAGGMPVVPDPLAQALYPLAWPRAVLPFELAFTLWFPLHGALAGAGAALLARRLGARTRGACLAAAAVALAGPIVGAHRHPNLLAGVAWSGFALAGLLGASDPARAGRERARDAALGASAVAMILLAGGVEILLLLGVVIGVWLPLRARAGTSPGAPGALLATGQAALAAGAVTALGAALAAPHLLPGLLWLPNTGRGVGVPAEQAVQWSLHPVRLLELVLPGLNPDTVRPLHDLLRVASGAFGQPLHPSVHLGLPVLLLAGFAARRERACRPAALAAVVLLALALGRYLPGPFALLRTLPAYDAWRYPAKALLPWVVLVGALAGVGLDRLRGARSRWAATAAVLCLVVGHLTCSSLVPTLPFTAYTTPPAIAQEIRAWEAARAAPARPPGRYLRIRAPEPRTPPSDFVAVREGHLRALVSDLPSAFGIPDLAVNGPFHARELVPYLISIRSGDGLDLGRLAEDAGVAHVLERDGLHHREVPPRLRLLDPAAGELETTCYEAERIEARVRLARPAWVYLSEPYDPGWTARWITPGAEPRDVPLRRERVAFTGLELPAGEGTLVLEYRTPGLGLGLVLWALGLVVIAALLAQRAVPGSRAT